MDNSDECEACWICLEGIDGPEMRPGPVHANRLIKPCRCPRVVHSVCLAKWQLSQSGKSEEKFCRFCKERLPDWQENLALPGMAAVEPVMSVHFNGLTHMVKVKPGEEGRLAFIQDVRRLLRLRENQEFSISFECKVPGHGMFLDLKGLSSYDAAVFCAAMTAVERQRLAAHKAHIFGSSSAASGRSGHLTSLVHGRAASAAAAANGQFAAAGRTAGPGVGSLLLHRGAARASDSGVGVSTDPQQHHQRQQQRNPTSITAAPAAAGRERGGSNASSSGGGGASSSSGSGGHSGSGPGPGPGSRDINQHNANNRNSDAEVGVGVARAVQTEQSDAPRPVSIAAFTAAAAAPGPGLRTTRAGADEAADYRSRAPSSSSPQVASEHRSSFDQLSQFLQLRSQQQLHPSQELRSAHSGSGRMRPTHWDSACEVEPSGHTERASSGGAAAAASEDGARVPTGSRADGADADAAAGRHKEQHQVVPGVVLQSGLPAVAMTTAPEGRGQHQHQHRHHQQQQELQLPHITERRQHHGHHHTPWLSRLVRCVGFWGFHRSSR